MPQEVCQFLIVPPAPNGPVFPEALPSVFKLRWPGKGSVLDALILWAALFL